MTPISAPPSNPFAEEITPDHMETMIERVKKEIKLM